MTTALRAIDCTDPQTRVTTLLEQNRQLQRDLTSARARNSTLMAALRRAVQAPAIVGQSVVDGMLTLTYATGRVMQLQPTAEYHEHSTEFAQAWVDITPAPDTTKAILDGVTAADEAARDADDDALYDPTFRTLAGLALHGMAVSAGGEQ